MAHTILIAHSDGAFAKHLGAVLRYEGYRSSPPVPGTSCNTSHCPLVAGADLMICDPELTVVAIRAQAPHIRVAATGKAALIQQLNTLLAATQAVVR